jgi:FlaA1/EpsC-like NDP-sugar epimerase
MIPKVKKFFIATQIVFYIIKYYLGKNYNYIIFYFQRDFIWFELKSIIPIILTSFFIYYFIIIELSIMLFGYSLLCYRFTFVMLAYFLIVSWRLEAEFIKDEIKFNLQSKIQPWVEFYGGQNPLSLYDYLTFYRRRPLF